ncbi:hypothetical protein D3C81_1674640 [compost metagenome]
MPRNIRRSRFMPPRLKIEATEVARSLLRVWVAGAAPEESPWPSTRTEVLVSDSTSLAIRVNGPRVEGNSMAGRFGLNASSTGTITTRMFSRRSTCRRLS